MGEDIQDWVIEKTPDPLRDLYDRLDDRVKQHFRYTAKGEERAVFLIFGTWARFFVAITLMAAAFLFPEDYFSKPDSWIGWMTFERSYFLALDFLLPLISISSYFIYASALLAIIIIKSSQQLPGKQLQVLADIVLAFFTLYLHHTPINELYIMFIIPIVLAGRYFRIITLVVIWSLVALVFGWTTANSSTPEYWRSINEYRAIPLPFSVPWWFFYIWIPKMFVLTIIAGLAFYYKRTKEYVVRDREEIVKQQWETGQELQQEYEEDKLVMLFCKKAKETIPGAENSVLHRYDPTTQRLKLAKSYPTNTKVDAGMTFKLGEGIAGIALKDKESINVPDVRTDKRYIGKPGGRSYSSLLTAPLYVGEKHIGTISVDNTNPDAFSELSEHLLDVLATQASTALANAIEFSERGERHKRQQQILLYGQTELTPRAGMKELLKKVVYGANELLGHEKAAVFVFGFIPLRLPGVNLDKNFDMGNFIRDETLQKNLRIFIEERNFPYSYPPNPRLEDYDCYTPLIGTDNNCIGLLALGCDGGRLDNRDKIHDIWLYTGTVSREIEEAISLETQEQLIDVDKKLQKTVEPEKDAHTLSNFFSGSLGFQRGVVKISAFLGWDDGFEPFGLSDEEFDIVRINIMQKSRNPHWIRENRTKLNKLTIIPGVKKNTIALIYFPWYDEWVQKEFMHETMRFEGAHGFLYISAWGTQECPLFEAVLNVSKDMVPPAEGEGQRLYALVDSMIKTADNVRLAAAHAIEDTRQAERGWLRADIHDALNILQGGPMFLTTAARNELVRQLSELPQQDAILNIVNWLEISEKGTRFAYDNLSRIMEEFGQSTLLNKGLVEALREFQELFLFKEKLQIKIDSEIEKELPSETRYGLYRIILEAVNNAFKHGGIKEKEDGKVIVSLKRANVNWILHILDNGQGFTDPVEIIKSQTTSFGLRQMEKWSRMLEGNLEINTAPTGTLVQVRFNSSEDNSANDRQ